MITVSLDRLIGYGPLLSVFHRWEAYDDEDMRRAEADGEWQVWGRTAGGEESLASGDDEAEAKTFAGRVGGFLGVPVKDAEIVYSVMRLAWSISGVDEIV